MLWEFIECHNYMKNLNYVIRARSTEKRSPHPTPSPNINLHNTSNTDPLITPWWPHQAYPPAHLCRSRPSQSAKWPANYASTHQALFQLGLLHAYSHNCWMGLVYIKDQKKITNLAWNFIRRSILTEGTQCPKISDDGFSTRSLSGEILNKNRHMHVDNLNLYK